jgi:hypothetical protein
LLVEVFDVFGGVSEFLETLNNLLRPETPQAVQASFGRRPADYCGLPTVL